MAGRPIAAITGLGFSALSRKPGPSARRLACDAVRDAAADAGLALSSIDGLLLNRSPIEPFETLPLNVQRDLGLRDLRLLASIEGEGSSVVQMIQYAALAVQSGMATRVACVFADAPISAKVNAGQAFAIPIPLTGIDGWEREIGLLGAAPAFAFVASRYMALYGARAEDFGAWAIAERQWAMRNPRAFLRTPLTIEDYLASRPIARPIRMLDCAYPVNGGVAFIVARIEEAEAARPPVYIHGIGQGHSGCPAFGDLEPEFDNGAATAGRIAYDMAGVGPGDVSSAQFYAPFTCAGIVALENYGFCGRGEGAAFVAEGHIAPGGTLPVNTGGGHLSGFYLQGATPLSEAVIQVRGEGGERQAPRNDVVLATGLGGRQEHHSALILSPHASLS
ncbi:MAG: putative thiolase/acyl transferase [Alphaproteobacteria bacterium]|nr:putative thiolase/acyl transferase [Alphaproteobacteria bacterium]